MSHFDAATVTVFCLFKCVCVCVCVCVFSGTLGFFLAFENGYCSTCVPSHFVSRIDCSHLSVCVCVCVCSHPSEGYL